eukprot:8766813-Lingulodinium_polyedra.AAC.1
MSEQLSPRVVRKTLDYALRQRGRSQHGHLALCARKTIWCRARELTGFRDANRRAAATHV